MLPLTLPHAAFCCILLCLASGARGQQYVYVNTDNLLLRNRPDREFTVYAVLHAPTRLKVAPYKNGYNRSLVTNRFYEVHIAYTDGEGIYHFFDGWVDKRYVVKSPQQVRSIRNRRAADFWITWVVPTLGPNQDPSLHTNCDWFPYPKYKGGETTAPKLAHTYIKGPHGGCYYRAPSGRKVYVDKSFCR